MGNLTTIVIHNDAMGAFEKDPEGFGKAILKAVRDANHTHKRANAGFAGYANYITSFPSRHADDETLYFHTGNTVIELNEYSSNWTDLRTRLPDYAKELVTKAKKRINALSKLLKKPLTPI